MNKLVEKIVNEINEVIAGVESVCSVDEAIQIISYAESIDPTIFDEKEDECDEEDEEYEWEEPEDWEQIDLPVVSQGRVNIPQAVVDNMAFDKSVSVVWEENARLLTIGAPQDIDEYTEGLDEANFEYTRTERKLTRQLQLSIKPYLDKDAADEIESVEAEVNYETGLIQIEL